MKAICRTLFFTLTLVIFFSVQGEITLPQLIADHMVIQRDVKTMVWGWADPGERISVTFKNKTFKTSTGKDGSWKVTLDAYSAGGPFTMKLSGENTITLTDIYIGDVWFFSGQSNMVNPMERVKERYPEEVVHVNYPKIRNFFIPTKSDVSGPQKDLPSGEWKPIVGDNIMTMGSVSYFFSKMIQEKYDIPIGIINASVGGTPIQAWMSENGFNQFPEYQEEIATFKDGSYREDYILPGERNPESGSRPEPAPDLGTSGSINWYDPDFKPEGWHDYWLPGYWEDQGIADLNGVVWFRKEIDVPAAMTGKPANLYLGRIVDADEVYVNGEKSGNITYQYPPRRYPLPADRLKPGKNIIVVRVTNNYGKGGFVPDKPYFLVVGKDSIDLRGAWKYRVGQVFPPFNFNRGGGSNGGKRRFSAQNAPTGLYNTMVAPVIQYKVKGFAWYQGESNTGTPEEYEGLLTSLIADWRSHWGQGALPFIFVQLANFMEVDYWPVESNWAELREGQREALTAPNSAMAVAIDLGEWNDIHPLNKKDVGVRIALAAENLAYGDKDVVYSGPLYKFHTIEGNKVIISFDHVGSGLVAKGNEGLQHFAIAGEDGEYVWGQAEIQGDKVVVWSDAIENPVSVRYAWANNPDFANLYNEEGLPASPFETME